MAELSQTLDVADALARTAQNSTVQVKIGGEAFQLFTSEDGAWTANKDEDRRLVKSMVRGNRMIVKGTSSRGTATTDTYSLKGFTAAYNAITESCGGN